ncbi:hypothetical protein LCM02_09360 [Lutimonas saemankumensis]|uniref:hypothetical protein n=1 Tax=Lutimonas saemankumensis TaxID=483016 RepID=UPI001CD2DF16|nr:hypothetical protein [Lutimonas saemankumensis]MCA0932658.1 hypothetical protein [Lutimonas saemankumensis]
MLLEVNQKEFESRFSSAPHPFLESVFLELNKQKVERLVYLLPDNKSKIQLGMIAGIKDDRILSPFSAPFGGLHFRHNSVLSSQFDHFVNEIKLYIEKNNLRGFKLTLPPDIYHQSINSKMVNSLVRADFKMKTPEITCSVDLKSWNSDFTDANTRRNYRKAVKYDLKFRQVEDLVQKEVVYNLILENRKSRSRPLHMKFSDILMTNEIWPIDYFQVLDGSNIVVASAIIYRAHKKIVYATFLGDTKLGRSLKSMTFLIFNLWNHYKSLEFETIDWGISTELGEPNEGLLRFKECHEGISSLRYSFEFEF